MLGAKQTAERAKHGFLADYSRQDARLLNKMYPTILSARGTQNLDEIAEEYGYDSGDDLFQALMYPDRPIPRKGEDVAENELDRMAREEAERQEEEYFERARAEEALGELDAEGIDAERIEASRESVVADLEEEARQEEETYSAEEIDAELESFFEDVAKPAQPAQPTPESFKGKTETGSLAGLSAAETFTLANPETEMGTLRPLDRGPRTAGMFDAPVPAESPAPKEPGKSDKLDDFGEKVGGARKDTAERGFTMSRKASREDEGPAWKRRYKAAESVKNPGQWTIIDTKSQFGGGIRQKFPSREAAEAAIPLIAVARQHTEYQNSDGTYSIYKKTGERKRLKVVNQNFPSREEAMKYMAEHAEEILEIKTSFGEEILPIPEIAIRKGTERRTGPATPEMFMETFAPRGIEFGNWNNQEERQQVMDHAYDGLLDLADALGLPPKALTLNGDLAIAFGARGQGLSGARAHYEPDYGVINLTKMKGAGALAHEWMHALDHYLARLDTKATTEKKPNERGDMVYPWKSPKEQFQSHGHSYKSEMRVELRDAYKRLMDALYTKAEQYVEDTQKAEKFLSAARLNLRETLDGVRRELTYDHSEYRKNKFGKPAGAEQLAEFDRLADILVEGGDLETKYKANEKVKGGWGGRYTNDTLESLNAVIKAVRNRSGFNTEKTGSLDRVVAAMGTYKARLQMFEDAKAGTEKTKRIPTSYAIEAKKMDQARSGDYWGEPHEMVARAFSAYAEDKIAERGGQSDFLVYHAHGGILLPMIDGFVARPYPEGKEREAINAAFDTFIKEIRTRETPKGVEMYSVERGAVRSGASFAEQLDDFAAGKIPNRREQIEIGETPTVLQMLGAERLPLVVMQGVINKAITEDKNEHGHGISIETLKQLPDQLADPVMVFDSRTQVGSLVIMTELQQDGKTIVAAIDLSKEFGHNVVNDITTIHQRKSEHHFINWINQGLLRYQNRQKSRAWSLASGLQLPRVSGPMHGFGGRERFRSGLQLPRGGTAQGKNRLLYDSDLVKWENENREGQPSAAASTTPGWTLADVQRIFKGQEIVQTSPEGPIFIQTRGGQYLTIESVTEISPDEVNFKMAYGRRIDKENETIVGAYGDGTIRLVRGRAGAWTLAHESIHFMEDAGILNRRDVAALKNHIQAMVKAGRRETANPKDIGGAEDRANFIADQLESRKASGFIGQIIDRVRQFIDRIAEVFGVRTAGAVVRDVASGKVFEGAGENAGSVEQYSTQPLRNPDAKRYQIAKESPRQETQEEPGVLRRAFDEFIYQAQDRFNYLNKAQIEAARKDRRELPEEQDAYLAETRYHGKAGAAIDRFEEQHIDPLLKIIEEANLSVEEADRYLHARHAREANARLRAVNPTKEEVERLIRGVKFSLDGLKAERAEIRKQNPDGYHRSKRYRETEKEMGTLHAEIGRLENYSPVKDNTALSGMTDIEAVRILTETRTGGKAKAYQAIGEAVDAITQARRDLLVEAGLETQETIGAWEAAYSYYVPLMREGKAGRLGKGRGFEVRGGQKLRGGSQRDVVNILANVVAQHEATIVRAEKVEVGRAFLEFARNHEGPWKIDTPEQVATYTQDGLIAYRPNPIGYILADNVFSVRVDGEDHHITFDDRNENAMKIAAALKNLDAGDAGAFGKFLPKVARYLAMVNTSLNPEFIISNFTRDIQTAAYNMADTEADAIRMKALREVGKAFRGIRDYQNKERGTEWAEWFNRFRNAGAQTGWIQAYDDIGDREKALIRKIENMKPGSIRTVKRGLEAALDYISDANEAVENAVRLSVFKNLIEAGVSEGKAARIAKELTVNFNRRGNMGPVLNTAYLFFNASIQGSARIILAASKSRKVQKLMLGTVAFAAMLDMANRLWLGGDDDDGEPLYDKIPSWEKDRNLIIMLGKSGYVKIPLPWGYNVFHVLGQAAGEAISKEDNKPMDSALRVLGAAWSAFNPIGSESTPLQAITPTLLDPFVQWAENKDWSGRKLRPEGNPFAEKPSSQSYWNSVRVPSKWIAAKLNELTGGDEVRPGKIDISPEAIDLAIDTVTGGTGKFVSNLISTPIKAAKGEDVETYEIPFLRRLYGKPGKQVLTQEFYENMDDARLLQRQLNHYKHDPKKIREIITENRAKMRLIDRAKATAKALQALREQRQLAERIEDPERKKERLETIEKKREALMKSFNAHYNRLKKGSEK